MNIFEELKKANIEIVNKNLAFNTFGNVSARYKKDFFILGSAHNIKQIKTKENQKVNLIFISSIFKKNKNFLGLIRFNNLTKLTNKKCIALGGISEKNKNLLRLTNSFGFAGISFFE